MNEEVLEFIRHFDTPMHESRDKFLHGQCYWFMKILEARFGPLHFCLAYYNQIYNHFALCIDGFLYDAQGAVGQAIDCCEHGWIEWRTYKEIEPSDSVRVIRDCVLQLPSEQEILDLKAFLYIF